MHIDRMHEDEGSKPRCDCGEEWEAHAYAKIPQAIQNLQRWTKHWKDCCWGIDAGVLKPQAMLEF